VNGPSSPQNERSVKELMLGVIEMQIKKNPCGQGVSTAVNVVTSEGAPTISSILKTDHRTDMLRPSSGISRGSYHYFMFTATFAVVNMSCSCLSIMCLCPVKHRFHGVIIICGLVFFSVVLLPKLGLGCLI
jgi:hypothetical protein